MAVRDLILYIFYTIHTVGKEDAFLRQAVNIGCVNFTAIASHIGVSQVWIVERSDMEQLAHHDDAHFIFILCLGNSTICDNE
jgi:hypothetical protein